METNFFAMLVVLNAGCDWTIAIKQRGDIFNVAMLPVYSKDSEPAMKSIIPFRMSGTAAMIDKAVFDHLQQPAAMSLELTTNNIAHTESIKQAKEKSRAETEKRQQQEKEQERQKQQYEAAIKKADGLAGEKKYGEAIAVLQKVMDLSEYTGKLTQKISELRTKHGQLSLL